MYDRLTCEHEAAHAVLGRHFGVRILSLRADRPAPGAAGWCDYDPDGWFPPEQPCGMSLEAIAAAKAPEVWIRRFREKAFPDGDPGAYDSDRAAVDHVLDQAGCWNDPLFRLEYVRRAEGLAYDVLGERHDDVLRLANRLQRHGYWNAETGWGRPKPKIDPRYPPFAQRGLRRAAERGSRG